MRYFYILIGVILFSTAIQAQDINQFDSDGKRHGKWSKLYEGTNIPRYEGTFFHGKEIDTFKYYKSKDKKPLLVAIKVFNKKNDTAEVKFFGPKGKVISEGKLNGKLYIGTWKYYHKNSTKLLMVENYNRSGQLDGEKLVYYENGVLTEIENYKKGKLDGVSKKYSKDKILMHEYTYEAGELHGPCKVYDSEGKIRIEGQFKRDKKEGIWRYYNDGIFKEKKDFSYKPKYIKKDGKYVKNPLKK